VCIKDNLDSSQKKNNIDCTIQFNQWIEGKKTKCDKDGVLKSKNDDVLYLYEYEHSWEAWMDLIKLDL